MSAGLPVVTCDSSTKANITRVIISNLNNGLKGLVFDYSKNTTKATMFKFLSKVAGICGYVVQYGCITHCTFEYLGDFVVVSG